MFSKGFQMNNRQAIIAGTGLHADALDVLVETKQIISYEFYEVDADGNIGGRSESRNTERLILHFPNGAKVEIDSFCAGYSQNSVLMIE
jgi:hypothetical protein